MLLKHINRVLRDNLVTKTSYKFAIKIFNHKHMRSLRQMIPSNLENRIPFVDEQVNSCDFNMIKHFMPIAKSCRLA